FVSAELRNRGVGTRLLEEMRKCLETEAASVGHGRVRGLFTELQRSGQVEVGIRERVRFWRRAGVLPFAVDWRYPPRHQGEPPVRMYGAYGSYGSRREIWYPRDLETVATTIFQATYDYLPDAGQTLQTILNGLRSLAPDEPVPYMKLTNSAERAGRRCQG